MGYSSLAWFAVGLVFLAAVVFYCLWQDIQRDEDEARIKRLRRHRERS